MWFFDLDGTEQGDLALVAVLIAAVLVIAAVPEQHLSGLGQVLDEFVIENISVFAVSGVDANGRRPGDALGTTKRQRVQATTEDPLATTALAPMRLGVDVATTRQLALVTLLPVPDIPVGMH